MSSETGGATIDSLVTFKYKKKFSFSNNRKLNTTTSDDDENGNEEGSHASDDSSQTDTDVEELREKNMNWKGSARLKSSNADRLDSSPDEIVPKKKHNKKYFVDNVTIMYIHCEFLGFYN
jgi:hypothetical protein